MLFETGSWSKGSKGDICIQAVGDTPRHRSKIFVESARRVEGLGGGQLPRLLALAGPPLGGGRALPAPPLWPPLLLLTVVIELPHAQLGLGLAQVVAAAAATAPAAACSRGSAPQSAGRSDSQAHKSALFPAKLYITTRRLTAAAAAAAVEDASGAAPVHDEVHPQEEGVQPQVAGHLAPAPAAPSAAAALVGRDWRQAGRAGGALDRLAVAALRVGLHQESPLPPLGPGEDRRAAAGGGAVGLLRGAGEARRRVMVGHVPQRRTRAPRRAMRGARGSPSGCSSPPGPGWAGRGPQMRGATLPAAACVPSFRECQPCEWGPGVADSVAGAQLCKTG